ncbi:hypothetical protein I4U23_026997 [Adineta vaga]|nr:hypothetical protein I4U23_026997 [Adineta vaga]
MFDTSHFVSILFLFCLNTSIVASSIKCYSCYQDSCPKPWNLNKIDQITSPSGWCLTFSEDNVTEDAIYARNGATPGHCTEAKCEWHRNATDAWFYSCCCNTNLCNGHNGQKRLTNNLFTILIIVFSFLLFQFI